MRNAARVSALIAQLRPGGRLLSGFMNTIGVVALFLPIVLDISRRTKQPPSKLLMPLAFAALLGGLNTLIGTPPNILISASLKEAGLRPFQMFDFAVPAMLAGSVALLYLWLIAPRLIPERRPPLTEESRRVYTAQLTIAEGSPHAGKSLFSLVRKAGPDFHVRRILRDDNLLLAPLPDVQLKANDRLLVTDTVAQLRAAGIELWPTDSIQIMMYVSAICAARGI